MFSPFAVRDMGCSLCLLSIEICRNAVLTLSILPCAQIVFFVASRGHHADVGGITPGSMPPTSRRLVEEGAAVISFKLVRNGAFQARDMYPVWCRSTLVSAPLCWTQQPLHRPCGGSL